MSSPFHPTSSSSHSSSISRSSCCPSTSTKMVVTLCTPPTRRWGLRTSPSSAHLATDRRRQAWGQPVCSCAPSRCHQKVEWNKPGDPLADCIFNFTFGVLLKRVHSTLAEEGLVAVIPMPSGEEALFAPAFLDGFCVDRCKGGHERSCRDAVANHLFLDSDSFRELRICPKLQKSCGGGNDVRPTKTASRVRRQRS